MTSLGGRTGEGVGDPQRFCGRSYRLASSPVAGTLASLL